MKRAAISWVLFGATLLATACTNDFDSLFVDLKGDKEPSGDGGKQPAPNDDDIEDDDEPSIPTKAGVKTCPGADQGDPPNDCTLACKGGDKCVADCEATRCTLVSDGAPSDMACIASNCTAECKNGSTCFFDCTRTGTCDVTCDATSNCSVSCGKGDCNVTCDGQKSVSCKDGSRVCGRECTG